MGFILTFIDLLFNALFLCILGSVIMSWIDPMGNYRISHILREIVEPILSPIRRVLPTIGMFDFSPIVALLLLQLIRGVLLSVLGPSTL